MVDKKEVLEDIRLFVLDLDGTFYLGEQVIDGAMDFIRTVENSGRRYVFLTNNSSKAPEDYMVKLSDMGCPIEREQIITSGDIIISYLKKFYPGKSVYLLGTEPLFRSFKAAGIKLVTDAPDLVVVGFDQALTYERLERACTFIRNGAIFLATHPDINCPVPGGFIPDCGAICSAITLSTGVEPRFLGKPYPETVEGVLQLTGEKRRRMAFVGDRLYTDVASGVKNDSVGLLVLTGETTLEDLSHSDIQPDAVFESLGEMAKYL